MLDLRVAPRALPFDQPNIRIRFRTRSIVYRLLCWNPREFSALYWRLLLLNDFYFLLLF